MSHTADTPIPLRRRGARPIDARCELRTIDGGGQSPVLVAGQVRRHSKLGSEARYRLLDVNGPLVEVEVLDAPGIAPGARFRFARRAVLAMTLTGGGFRTV